MTVIRVTNPKRNITSFIAEPPVFFVGDPTAAKQFEDNVSATSWFDENGPNLGLHTGDEIDLIDLP